jgi:hypothetical protein
MAAAAARANSVASGAGCTRFGLPRYDGCTRAGFLIPISAQQENFGLSVNPGLTSAGSVAYPPVSCIADMRPAVAILDGANRTRLGWQS